ncbi:MAG TPA: exo-beta-N-acetylmuramidase NamZ domain-containing protein, partial [Pyrinomonadaceae bacterium]|nr:exo-beta-N-acetylmuramidase NamZ domain-containing protein [Pyrinomonadaceae bacterium]
MFERYTEKARRVIFFARYEASMVGAPAIEPEHLLLGLLREDREVVSRFFSARASINIEAIRKEIEGRTLLREKISTSVELPLAPETKRVLAYAHEESDRLQHRHIGTEHLLLGLLREDRSMAAEILYERGLRLNAVRDKLASGQRVEASVQTRTGIEGLIDEIRSHGQRLVALSNNLRHGLCLTSVEESYGESFQKGAEFEFMEILKKSVERKRTVLGLERLLNERVDLVRGARVGLICNQASVDHNLMHAADLLNEHKEIDLRALFGPQHGIRGDVQDNMIETPHATDRQTGLTIYSLYSETREPTEEMLKDVDVLVFDMQDVGCRIYTFIYTMANCMRAARKMGKRVVVCDRPNPINGVQLGGNLLEVEFASFVGQFPIPTRHGMTVCELARMFNEHFGIGCELEVVTMEDWERELWLDETDAPWVLPSPNMP